ncbi:hypothetical protein ABPG72_006999 [Tetrahymena utriculariae]
MAQTYFGTPAKFGSLINWFNPLPLFLQCYLSKTFEPLQPFRYCISTFVLMTQNVFAKITNNSPLLFTSSQGGILFFIYATSAFLMKRQMLQYLTYLTFLAAWALILQSMDCAFVGSTLCLIQSMSSFSPIQVIIKAFKQKNHIYINPYSLLLNFMCNFLWVSYGFEIQQMTIIIPNLVEILIVVLQLSLYVIYKNIYTKSVNINSFYDAIKSCDQIQLQIAETEKVL